MLHPHGENYSDPLDTGLREDMHVQFATEAAITILRIDDMIKIEATEDEE